MNQQQEGAAEKFDPYAVLDIERAATTVAVLAAYKRRAKETHPDLPGGSAEAFQRVKLAHDVLSDVDRRKKYDDTGTIDAGVPDNLRGNAFQTINRHLGAIINEFMGAPDVATALAKDPRRIDLPGEIKRRVADDIAAARASLDNGAALIAVLEDLARRFRPPPGADGDPLTFLIVEQATRNRQAYATIERGIAVNEHALQIIAEYGFDQIVDGFVFQGGLFVPQRQ
jgi:curved DNA-binding protein CbpA